MARRRAVRRPAHGDIRGLGARPIREDVVELAELSHRQLVVRDRAHGPLLRVPMPQRRFYDVRASFAALLLSSVAPFGAAAQSGGSVSAVNPRTTGTPPGGGSRSLQIGSNVIYKERVQTSET